MEGNCKYYARIKVLETVVNAIEERLKNKGEEDDDSRTIRITRN